MNDWGQAGAGGTLLPNEPAGLAENVPLWSAAVYCRFCLQELAPAGESLIFRRREQAPASESGGKPPHSKTDLAPHNTSGYD